MYKIKLFTIVVVVILFFKPLHYKIFAQIVDDSIKTVILKSMDQAESSWNQGNLEGFMHNYWRSDSLRFIGKKGITYGWEKTLSNYNKGYPNEESRGKLKFNCISIEYLGRDCILMVGKWQIDRKNVKLEGYYSLIWKKIDGKWCIIFDHSS